MADLEIGWIVGSNSAQDRPLQFVRAAVQGVLLAQDRPRQLEREAVQESLDVYELVTVPGGAIRPGLPVILDITADGYDIRIAIKLIVERQVTSPYLIIQRSGWCDLDPELVKDLEVQFYRHAHNVKPIIEKYLSQVREAASFNPDSSIS